MTDDVMSRVIRVIAETQRIPADTVRPESTFRRVEDRLAGRHQHRLRHRERVQHQRPRRSGKVLTLRQRRSCEVWRSCLPAARVAVTGMGAVSALGCGVDPFWEAIHGPFRDPTDHRLRAVRFPNGAQVCGFDPARALRRKAFGAARPVRAIRACSRRGGHARDRG